jgi:hypothetical protein
MADDLATAAVFGDQTQAVAARLHLEASGIPAFLADELVAGGIFMWSPAVGGVKLQVPESRLEEAMRLLDEHMPNAPGSTDWSQVDVGSPEEDEPLQDAEEQRESEPPSSLVDASSETAFGEPTLREQQAEVLYRGWLFGLFVFPVMFFMWWQLIWVALSPERLSADYRRMAIVAGIGITCTTLLWIAVGLVVYFALFD